MTGRRDPMEGAGWGSSKRREGLSERDPAFKTDRTSGRRLPLGALLIAAVGMVAGLIGSLTVASGTARFDISVSGGFARAGFGVAILAGLWISFGARDRAAGAQLIGVAIVAFSVIALIVSS